MDLEQALFWHHYLWRHQTRWRCFKSSMALKHEQFWYRRRRWWRREGKECVVAVAFILLIASLLLGVVCLVCSTLEPAPLKYIYDKTICFNKQNEARMCLIGEGDGMVTGVQGISRRY